MSNRLFTPILLLVMLMCFPQAIWPQEAPRPGEPSAAPRRGGSRGLRILVLEGQDAVNSLPLRLAANPAVQVFDSANLPVEGAEVIFEAPATGPGGVFENLKNIFATRTDSKGQAVSLFTPNTLPGSFVVRVTARLEGETVSAVIRQTNSPDAEAVQYKPVQRRWYKDWKWWAVIGAGAGAGGYFATRSTTTASVPIISLIPGVITIGGPR